MGRGVPARPHARPDGCANRGHRRPVRAVSRGQGQGRRRVPGPGQGVSRPGPGPAAQAEEGRDTGGSRRLGRGAPPAVIGTDLRGHANAEHKQWRTLQRFLGHAKTSTRPTWPLPAWYPTAPPRGDHQSDSPPGQHTPTSIAQRQHRQGALPVERRRTTSPTRTASSRGPRRPPPPGTGSTSTPSTWTPTETC